jgi:hypothetical protein
MNELGLRSYLAAKPYLVPRLAVCRWTGLRGLQTAACLRNSRPTSDASASAVWWRLVRASAPL